MPDWGFSSLDQEQVKRPVSREVFKETARSWEKDGQNMGIKT